MLFWWSEISAFSQPGSFAFLKVKFFPLLLLPMSLSFFGVAPRSKQIQTNRRLIEMEIELPEDQEVGGENKKSSCNQVILGRFHLGHCCLDSLARDSPMLRLKKCNRLSINLKKNYCGTYFYTFKKKASSIKGEGFQIVDVYFFCLFMT